MWGERNCILSINNGEGEGPEGAEVVGNGCRHSSGERCLEKNVEAGFCFQVDHVPL